MADDWPEGAPALPPGVLIPGSAQVTTDEIIRQRQAELQAAADQYVQAEKRILSARQKWENQREGSRRNLVGQAPKVLGTWVGLGFLAALLAYIVPLGDDR